jgi:hypothetical protein
LAKDFFQNLFNSSNPVSTEQVVDLIDRVITEDMNQWLVRDFIASEVRHALYQMPPTKTLGPDGMLAIFFQTYWHIVGHDFTLAVLDFLNTGCMLHNVNFTHIALIPKTKSAESLSQFRPISLCNVIYKTISKVLANRLKVILPSIISDSQSAFVPGRLITDNIMVAFETLHYMKTKRQGRTTHMAAKLNMSKAYDQVEWRYLEDLMLKIGFHASWVQLIMKCISTVSYSALLNGKPTDIIIPERGLRQGDPLSPYLFLLCAKGLSTLLQKSKADHKLCGVAVSRGGPRVNHLLFADDSLLFFRANNSECQVVKEILWVYETASGQKLNCEKMALFFSANTSPDTAGAIRDLWGASNTHSIEKYLGLPSFIGRSKIKAFEDITTRVWKRLQGWKEKFLSQIGKEVLIKAVVQAIPVYAMSCFRISDGICDSLNSLMSNFWWGQCENERKVHWRSWIRICSPKKDGGMGFHDLRLFNKALLAKQGWNLNQNPNSLIGRIYRAKYYPHSSFLESKVPNHSSFIWRSLASARDLIVKGSRWCVGNGNKIRIWQDNWIPRERGFKVISPQSVLPDNAKVSDLFSDSGWNSNLVDEVFLPFEAEYIKLISLRGRDRQDKLVWNGTKTGVFSSPKCLQTRG